MLKKKITSILLIACMLATFMPDYSFAAKEDEGIIKKTLLGSSIVFLKAKTVNRSVIRLSWNTIPAATEYIIYGNTCKGEFVEIESLSSQDDNKMYYNVSKIRGKKLKEHRFYKFYVLVKSGADNLARSKSIHFICNRTCGKYANAKSIKAKKKINLTVGKTAKVKARYVVYNNKKHIPKHHGRRIKYSSNNRAVARVDRKGVVTAISEGKAIIYSQDNGGKLTKTQVSVAPTNVDNKNDDKNKGDNKLNFDIYKENVKANCDSLLQSTDNDEVKNLIEKAKSDIDAIKYDANKSQRDNESLIDEILNKLKKDVDEARSKYGPTPPPKGATFKAVLDKDGTLSFYYDEEKHSDGTVYDELPLNATKAEDWGYNSKRSSINNVYIDPTVLNVEFTSLAYMFSGMTKLKYIENLTNIATANVKITASMFQNAGSGLSDGDELERLDFSNFDTSKVISSESMFTGCDLPAFTIGSKWNLSLVSCDASTSDVWFDENASSDSQFKAKEIDTNIIKKNAISGDKTKTFSKCTLKAILELTANPGYVDEGPCYTLHYYFDSRKASECSGNGNIVYSGNQLKQVGSLTGELFELAYNESFDQITELARTKYGYKEDFSPSGGDDDYEKAFCYLSQWGYIENKDKIISIVIDKKIRNYDELTTTSGMFALMPNVSKFEGFEYLNMRNVTDMSGMFMNTGTSPNLCESSVECNVPESNDWDTHNVSNMNSLFYNFYFNVYFYNNQKYSPKVGNWDTSNVQNMHSLFEDCFYSVFTLDFIDVKNWNTSKVTDFSCCFAEYGSYSGILSKQKKFIDIENWDISNATDLSEIFRDTLSRNPFIEEPPDVSKWDTSKAVTMKGMFLWYAMESTSLKRPPDVSEFNTSNVKDLSFCFDHSCVCDSSILNDYEAGSLCTTYNSVPDVSKWDVHNVVSFCSMFSGYSSGSYSFNSVPDVSKWDVSNGKYFNCMFFKYGASSYRLDKVPDVSNWDTRNAEILDSMFSEYGESSIYLSEAPKFNGPNWDTSKVFSFYCFMAGYGKSSERLGTLDFSKFDFELANDTYEIETGKIEYEYGYIYEQTNPGTGFMLQYCKFKRIILNDKWITKPDGDDNYQWLDGYWFDVNSNTVTDCIPSGEGTYERLCPLDGNIFYVDKNIDLDNYKFFDEEGEPVDISICELSDNGIPSADSEINNIKYYIKDDDSKEDSIYMYADEKIYAYTDKKISWSYSNEATNASSDAIGAGKSNTLFNLNNYKPQYTIDVSGNPYVDYKNCTLKLDFDGGADIWYKLLDFETVDSFRGYINNDWYIPSKLELNKLIEYISIRGDDYDKRDFAFKIWSSTEDSNDSSKAWLWNGSTWESRNKNDDSIGKIVAIKSI